LITCAMGLGGRMIIGVGTNKSLWVWRYDQWPKTRTGMIVSYSDACHKFFKMYSFPFKWVCNAIIWILVDVMNCM
jgi:hypothetical protein